MTRSRKPSANWGLRSWRSEAVADVLRVELGYDCERLAPDESKGRAKES